MIIPFEKAIQLELEGKKEEALEAYIFLARNNDINAIERLVVIYSDESDVSYIHNDLELINWAKKGKSLNSILSTFKLAQCYYEGNGVEKDLNYAISLYRKCADNNDSDSQLLIAKYYYEINDCNNFLYYLDKAIKNKNELAMAYCDEIISQKRIEIKNLETIRQQEIEEFELAKRRSEYKQLQKKLTSDLSTVIEFIFREKKINNKVHFWTGRDDGFRKVDTIKRRYK